MIRMVMGGEMKRCLIFSLTSIFGGGERYILILQESLKSVGLYFSVSNQMLATRLVEAGVSKSAILMMTVASRTDKLANALKAANFARRNRANLILLNGFTELQFSPIFWLFGFETVVVIHTQLLDRPRLLTRCLYWLGFFFANRVILVAEHLSRFVPKHAINKIAVIQNQLGSELLSLERTNVRECLKEVIFVGRVSKAKGIDDFVEVAAKFPYVHFTAIGPITDYALSIQSSFPSNVTLHGFVSDIAEHLARADAIIFPSRSEGMPYAVLEAAAAGLPMIVSKIPAHEEIAGKIRGILFYEPGRTDELSARIATILPQAVRSRLSKELRNDSIKFNDQQEYAKRYVIALSDECRERGCPRS